MIEFPEAMYLMALFIVLVAILTVYVSPESSEDCDD
jgi:cbb3-type cytochrome oxidase subunit 3